MIYMCVYVLGKGKREPKPQELRPQLRVVPGFNPAREDVKAYHAASSLNSVPEKDRLAVGGTTSWGLCWEQT